MHMRPGKSKSRSFRRKWIKLPGGRTVMHYEYRKPSKQRCANCSKELHGVVREKATKLARIAKTKKRPERVYGGVLCSRCAREKIKEGARKSL